MHSMTKTTENTTSSGSRSRLRSRAREIFTFSNLTKLPSNLAVARKFISVLDWKAAQAEVESELQHKVPLGLSRSLTHRGIYPNYRKKRSTKPRRLSTCSTPPREFARKISTSSTSY